MTRGRDIVEIVYTKHGYENSIIGYFFNKTESMVSLALEKKWFPGQKAVTYTNHKHIPIHKIVRVVVLRHENDTCPYVPSSYGQDAPIVGC